MTGKAQHDLKKQTVETKKQTIMYANVAD